MEHLIGFAPIACLEGNHTVPAKGCYFPLTFENLPDERILFLPYPVTKHDAPIDNSSPKNLPVLYAKALYRMSALGLIDEITRDDAQQRYRIILRKRPTGGYYRQLRKYFLRYYT